MPFYQYSASNSQGLLLQGTLQAASSDAAKAALTSAGYVVRELREQAAAASTPITANVPRISAPQVAQPRPVAQPVVNTSGVSIPRVPRPENAAPVHLNSPAAATNKLTEFKTKKGKDRDLFFLFTQLGSYFRSGMNPAQSLNDLTARTPERYRESLRYAAQSVSEGGTHE